jgi:hypothetical protein
MTVAAIDRLVHHATILEMNAESFRQRAAASKHRAQNEITATTTTDNQNEGDAQPEKTVTQANLSGLKTGQDGCRTRTNWLTLYIQRPVSSKVPGSNVMLMRTGNSLSITSNLCGFFVAIAIEHNANAASLRLDNRKNESN